jgi:hypothetical protein
MMVMGISFLISTSFDLTLNSAVIETLMQVSDPIEDFTNVFLKGIKSPVGVPPKLFSSQQ